MLRSVFLFLREAGKMESMERTSIIRGRAGQLSVKKSAAPETSAESRISLAEYCRQRKDDILLRQWDTAKNAPLTPEQVSRGSHTKIWWRCEHGHEWPAAVRSRTGSRPSGCPVCSGRMIVPGVNDLATRSPALAMQWDAEKNGALRPDAVAPGSIRKVWWRCERGHSWSAAISSRVSGCGCPVCMGQRVEEGFNDLATAEPDIAAQWHPTRNGVLTPQQVTVSSNRSAWWTCPRGHVYRAVIAQRTNGKKGCPYCAGRKVLVGFNDLAYTRPAVAAQWHSTLNGALTPQQVTAGSHRKAWWQCGEGHVWKANIGSRTGRRPSGCPVCAGRVSAAQVHRYEQLTKEN